ncbi:hypothetical protein, partial [Streptodolium elevatio]
MAGGVCCAGVGCAGPAWATSPDCTGPTGGGGIRGTSEPGEFAPVFAPAGGGAWCEAASGTGP